MPQDIDAADLGALLRTGSSEAIAEAMTRDFGWLTALPPVHERGDPAQPALPPHGALGIFLGARALIRTNRGARAWAFIQAALDAYAAAHPRGYRAYVRHTPLSDALQAWPNLHAVTVEALIAAGEWSDAAGALSDFTRQMRERDGVTAFTEDTLGPLAPLADGHALGPLSVDRNWVFARQRDLVGSGALDESKVATWAIHADYLIGALRAGAVEEAVSFVEAKAEAAWPIEDKDHYGFNAVCVLAYAGRTDEAIAAVRELVRRGYDMLWRFNRETAAKMWWTEKMGQLEWLAPLEGVPAFEDVRARYLTPRLPAEDGLEPGPFRLIEAATLTGRAGKKCALTRKRIAPGDPIYRFRLYFSHGNDPTIAGKAAFEASNLAQWRERHVANAYRPADFSSSSPMHMGQRFDAPAASAFLFDLIEGEPFNADAFIACIGAPKVFPMRFEWVRGKYDYWPEPEDGPFVNDAHAGDYVNLTWIMLRCGYGPDIFKRLSEIDPAIADPIFAMLAAFGREDCRQAASAHFGLEELPEIVDTVFQSRLSLDDVLKLADFGRDNARFADAMARAMATYNLHIYSNTHPQADWYLDDLQQYIRAKGCRLVFLFIHTPERLPVLAAMIARRWLVHGVGSGGYDGYGNTGHFLYQAAAMNRLLHAPDELPFWLETPWIETYVRGPALREIQRHVAAWRKRNPVRS